MNLLIGEAGSASPIVFHAQPVGQQPEDLCSGDDAADERQGSVPIERLDELRQRRAEVAVAEVAQSGAQARLLDQSVLVDARRGHADAAERSGSGVDEPNRAG